MGNDYEIDEEFGCATYGRAKQNYINAVIRLQFEERSKPSASKRPLNCIKSLEPSIFPPCKRTLTAVYQENLVHCATIQNSDDPISSGRVYTDRFWMGSIE